LPPRLPTIHNRGRSAQLVPIALRSSYADKGVSNNTFGAIGEIADTDTIAVLRERLVALYREDGTLCISITSGAGMEAVLEIPYELAAR
jgi:hypothetical protein